MNKFFYKVMALYSTHETSPINSSSIITKDLLSQCLPQLNCSFNFN